MKKPSKTAPLEIHLESRSRQPLGRQLYERLRDTIVLGALPRGRQLPPSRTLARRLGVSRNTVLFAYEELAADGLLSGTAGSGTRIERRPRRLRFTDPDGLTLAGLE